MFYISIPCCFIIRYSLRRLTPKMRAAADLLPFSWSSTFLIRSRCNLIREPPESTSSLDESADDGSNWSGIFDHDGIVTSFAERCQVDCKNVDAIIQFFAKNAPRPLRFADSDWSPRRSEHPLGVLSLIQRAASIHLLTPAVTWVSPRVEIRRFHR